MSSPMTVKNTFVELIEDGPCMPATRGNLSTGAADVPHVPRCRQDVQTKWTLRRVCSEPALQASQGKVPKTFAQAWVHQGDPLESLPSALCSKAPSAEASQKAGRGPSGTSAGKIGELKRLTALWGCFAKPLPRPTIQDAGPDRSIEDA